LIGIACLGNLICVLPQFWNGGRFPKLSFEHWANVEQTLLRPPVAAEQTMLVVHLQPQSKWAR